MKKLLIMFFLISSMSFTQQKNDSLFVMDQVVKEDRVPIEQMPLVCDESDGVFVNSLLLSLVAMGGSAIYGLFTHPFPFDNRTCQVKYISLITQQCIANNHPCNLEKPGWDTCINSLIRQYCGLEEDEYNSQLPDKKIAAWTPLMIAATASVAFNGSWLACKKIGRVLRSKIPFRPEDSTSIEMEQL